MDIAAVREMVAAVRQRNASIRRQARDVAQALAVIDECLDELAHAQPEEAQRNEHRFDHAGTAS